MAKVEIKKPNILNVEYYPEKTDKDYGGCLWARFVFDSDNYSLHIASDCGSYGYEWTPTPQTESFLKLISRVESKYLLSKIADMSTVDNAATYKAVEELINDTIECSDDILNIEESGIDMVEIHSACSYYNEQVIVDAINSELSYSDLEGKIDNFDLYDCIRKDYSVMAKKIGEIFEQFIKPKIKEILKENENN